MVITAKLGKIPETAKPQPRKPHETADSAHKGSVFYMSGNYSEEESATSGVDILTGM